MNRVCAAFVRVTGVGRYAMAKNCGFKPTLQTPDGTKCYCKRHGEKLLRENHAAHGTMVLVPIEANS